MLRLKYNPANNFSLYLDKVALVHEKSDTPSDFLFPFLRKSRFMLFTPWINLFFVQQCEIQVGLSRVELHSFIRGGGTLCCANRCPPFSVSKCMRVKTEAMVG